MTKNEFKDQVQILCETFSRKLSQKTIDSYYEDMKLYPLDQIKRAVQKIYMMSVSLEYGANILVLIKEKLKEMGFPEPLTQIKNWVSVIKYQNLYLKKNWEKKPPPPQKITCLSSLPDPLYWKNAVEQFKKEIENDEI